MSAESERYRFADLYVDAGSVRVFRGGAEIPLPGLSFDLLLALLRAAPNVVSTDQLMERVWPGLIVSPETVAQRVKLLRDALDDDSRRPRYLSVVRGRGYRMVPSVVSIRAQTIPVSHMTLPMLPARMEVLEFRADPPPVAGSSPDRSIDPGPEPRGSDPDQRSGR